MSLRRAASLLVRGLSEATHVCREHTSTARLYSGPASTSGRRWSAIGLAEEGGFAAAAALRSIRGIRTDAREKPKLTPADIGLYWVSIDVWLYPPLHGTRARGKLGRNGRHLLRRRATRCYRRLEYMRTLPLGPPKRATVHALNKPTHVPLSPHLRAPCRALRQSSW